jgi:hypothetical protein
MNNATTITVNGHLLSLTLSAPEELIGGARRYELVVSHELGGRAVFTVTNYRGEWTAYEVTREAPISVHRAILALVKRMTELEGWATRPLHEPDPEAFPLLVRACAERGHEAA